MIYFIIENVYPFMGLPRSRAGKPQKETEEKIRVTERMRYFINRKARKKTLKHILNETLLLYSYRSLLLLENVSDLCHSGMTENHERKDNSR